MKYICFNLHFTNNTLLEKELDSNTFRELAFNAKLKQASTKIVTYKLVLTELLNCPSEEMPYLDAFYNSHCICNTAYCSKEIKYSLYNLFNNVNKHNFVVDVVSIIDIDDIDVFYTDGSSSKKKTDSAYAAVRLEGKSSSKKALLSGFTKRVESYTKFSGKVENGTNNSGELSGVKTAIENSGNKSIQVIISDSLYALNTYREWIYNWKVRGYKNSTGKVIPNCELIKSIEKLIKESKKLYLFKWTKGHSEDQFNDLCDSLAKGEIGLND